MTIQSDDAQPSIGFQSGAVSVNEDAGTVTIPVTLSTASGSSTTVHYATSNGTAHSGSDYTVKSGTMTIPAGSTTGTISIDILNDDLYDDGDESFTVTLSNPTGATLNADAAATVTIIDDEAVPTLGFNTTAVSQSEGVSALELSVSLSGLCDAALTVDYATFNGTAKAGYDFMASSGTLSIPAGDDSATLIIVIDDDDTYEGNETFKVQLTNASSGVIGTDLMTITIIENDSKPTPEPVATPTTVVLLSPSIPAGPGSQSAGGSGWILWVIALGLAAGFIFIVRRRKIA